MNKYTHILDVKIGCNVSDILEPEKIKGVMYMLGVQNEQELTKAYLQHRYEEIQTTLGALKIDVLGGEVKELDNFQSPETKTTKEKSDSVNSVKTSENKEIITVFDDIKADKKIEKQEQKYVEITDEERSVIGNCFDFKVEHNDDEITLLIVSEKFKNKVRKDVVQTYIPNINDDTFVYKELGKNKLMEIEFKSEEEETGKKSKQVFFVE